MKENIHPQSKPVKITCTCGALISTISTLGKDFTIELCSKCHPFFTGKQRLIDTTGRVERFQKRYEKFNAANKTKKGDAAVEAKPEVEAEEKKNEEQ